jgi:hypothetical protein
MSEISYITDRNGVEIAATAWEGRHGIRRLAVYLDDLLVSDAEGDLGAWGAAEIAEKVSTEISRLAGESDEDIRSTVGDDEDVPEIAWTIRRLARQATGK